MKYVAKFLPHIDKWAVCFGKKYLTTKTYDDEDLAREAAVLENMRHYQQLAQDCFGKLCVMNGGDKYDGEVTLKDESYGENITFAEFFC